MSPFACSLRAKWRRVHADKIKEKAVGPFPHDAPPATISADNPMGTDGFEFVEYAHPNPEALHALFKLMGFVAVARHKTKKKTGYRLGGIKYLPNEKPGTHGFVFFPPHRPGAPSVGFCVFARTGGHGPR